MELCILQSYYYYRPNEQPNFFSMKNVLEDNICICNKGGFEKIVSFSDRGGMLVLNRNHCRFLSELQTEHKLQYFKILGRKCGMAHNFMQNKINLFPQTVIVNYA